MRGCTQLQDFQLSSSQMQGDQLLLSWVCRKGPQTLRKCKQSFCTPPGAQMVAMVKIPAPKGSHSAVLTPNTLPVESEYSCDLVLQCHLSIWEIPSLSPFFNL